MFEKYKDAEQLSCSNALDGRYCAKEIDGGRTWKDIDEDTCYELFKLCREFVASTSRGKRKTRILNVNMKSVQSCGILNRLHYDFENKRIEYIAGQDYVSEMAILRDCFDRR